MCDICNHFPCLNRCPNAPEPKMIGRCSLCGEIIIEGYEAYIDEQKSLFCSIKCACEKYEIHELDYEI